MRWSCNRRGRRLLPTGLPMSRKSFRSRWLTTASFMMNLSPTATGSKPRTTAMFTSRRWWSRIAHGGPIPTGNGFAPILDGPGVRMSPLDGRLFTTAAGLCFPAAAGAGCRAANGLHRGARGAKAADMSAGHRCLLKRSLTAVVAGAQMWMSSSVSPVHGSISSKPASWRTRLLATVSPSVGMPHSFVRLVAARIFSSSRTESFPAGRAMPISISG